MSIKYIITVIYAGWIAPQALADWYVGNGGDAVECHSSPQNNFVGWYSLDFLLTYDGRPMVPAPSAKHAVDNIRLKLLDKVPSLGSHLSGFVDYLYNQKFAEPRIWEASPFGLIAVDDERIVNQVPENCRSENQINIVQAIIYQTHEHDSSIPLGKVVYRFVPRIMKELELQNPIQLSFLLVHEWLWDLSDKVQTNRRVTKYLHSQKFAADSPTSVIQELRGMGLVWSDVPAIPNPDPRLGRLKISEEDDYLYLYSDGSWKAVCDDDFDEKAGIVACRELGGTYISYQDAQEGNHDNFATLDMMACQGSEPTYRSCGHKADHHSCYDNEFIKLNCQFGTGDVNPKSIPVPKSSKLFVGTNSILYYFHAGEYRGICDDGFTMEAAVVACRQMGGALRGFTAGVEGPQSLFWFDELHCSGSESHLLQCQHAVLGDDNCNSSEHVELQCDVPSIF